MLNRPEFSIASNADAVYAPITEQTFDVIGSENDGEGVQIQAEPTPPPLTVQAIAGADMSATGKSLLMNTLSLLKEQYASLITDTSILETPEARARLALGCARHAAALLTVPFADLHVAHRYELIFEFFHNGDADEPEGDFWDCLSTLLYRYAWLFQNPGWAPMMGVVPGNDSEGSMPAWRTADGDVVCDLMLYAIAPDSDAAIEVCVREAFRVAREEFGERVTGMRLVTVVEDSSARWYFPDLSWVPLAKPFGADSGCCL
ncbi:hypothetical protein [Microbacterium sp.]|uniref:hypothetical protein n=1 Tax=Microbacterium sp. TaxID=51671 RepID=UPI00273482B9|nr:hypothetical protein [Microbacterium sp.]MDP3950819.1 hypothetical protein [Microbacterium sp.]